MPNILRDVVLRHLRGAAAASHLEGRSDAELLRAFAQEHDQDAFTEIVRRRGPMVLSVCRRVLRHEQDTEDAFQATFALLARQPGAIRKQEALGSWLHGVAYRMAMSAKRAAARRRKQEGQAEPSRVTAQVRDEGWQEVQALLHEEIERLPAVYRAAFILRCIENRSGEEAARELGIKPGTVSSRLTKARQMLRSRLARRGVDLSAVLAGLAIWGTRPVVAAPLACRTVQAATQYAAQGPKAAGALSVGAAALLKGGKTAMLLNKIKAIVAVLVVLSLGGAGLGLAAREAASGREPGKEQQDAPVAQAPGAGARPKSGTAAPHGEAKRMLAGGPYTGTVLDQASGKPVASLAVRVRRYIKGKPAGEIKLVSDKAGRFRFDLPAAWAEPAEAKLAVHVEAPPGYVAFSDRYAFGDMDTVGGLRVERSLGLPAYFDRMRLYSTKQVRGRVLAPDGKPAAGVDVILSSSHPKAREPHQSVVRRTKTDAQGRFTAEVASPGTVALYLLPERYAIRYAKLTDPEGDLGEYKLQTGVAVAGKLRDAKDRPLAGRWVRVGGGYTFGLDGQIARWCRTDATGAFRTAPLEPGEYQASAHGPRTDPLTGREGVGEPLEVCVLPQTVVVRQGKTPQVMLRAVPHVNVTVQVHSKDRKLREGIPFALRYRFDGKWYKDWPDDRATSDRDGRAVIRLPQGASFADIWCGSGNTHQSVVCKFRAGKGDGDVQRVASSLWLKNVEADRRLEFVASPGVNASLRVTTKDGAPIEGAEVDDVRQGRENPCIWMGVGGGVYRLGQVEPDRPLTIRVRAKGYERVTRTVTLAAGAPRRVEIVLEKKKAKAR